MRSTRGPSWFMRSRSSSASFAWHSPESTTRQYTSGAEVWFIWGAAKIPSYVPRGAGGGRK
eukprot:1678030-Rhodomonas_salina.3